MQSTKHLLLWLPAGLALTSVTSQAGLDIWGEQQNRFGFSALGAFNVEASFRGLGGFPARTDIGPAAAGFDHVYDDGFNRVDQSGNDGGATWYWRYDRPSQFVNGESIVMSSTSALPSGNIENATDDPHWGGEITYARELGWNGSYWWGVVAGVSYMRVSIQQSESFLTDATRTRDSYRLLGPLPQAPYQGQFGLPGPQISDFPIREVTTLNDVASTTGAYGFDADVYGARIGLLFETPFTDWFSLQFGGGVAGGWVQGEFSYNESTVIPEVGRVDGANHDEHTDFVVGGYAEAGFSVQLTRRIHALASARYYYLTDFNQVLDGREVELSLKSTIAGSLGLTFAF